VELSGTEQIADLLAMTPHLFRTGAEGREKAAALAALSLTVDVRLTCFERNGKSLIGR
jgi:23S rRNA (guanine745-N1)-methyltransferase